MVLQRYFHGTSTILQWYSNGTSTILHRYFHGTSLILPKYFVLQYFSDTSMVLQRYSTDTPMVLHQYFTDTSMVLHRYFKVSEVSLFPPCSNPSKKSQKAESMTSFPSRFTVFDVLANPFYLFILDSNCFQESCSLSSFIHSSPFHLRVNC